MTSVPSRSLYYVYLPELCTTMPVFCTCHQVHCVRSYICSKFALSSVKVIVLYLEPFLQFASKTGTDIYVLPLRATALYYLRESFLCTFDSSFVPALYHLRELYLGQLCTTFESCTFGSFVLPLRVVYLRERAYHHFFILSRKPVITV